MVQSKKKLFLSITAIAIVGVSLVAGQSLVTIFKNISPVSTVWANHLCQNAQWFRITGSGGRVHSESESTGLEPYSICSKVPTGQTFNTAQGITSAFGDITFNPGSHSEIPPNPRVLRNYGAPGLANTSSYSYDRFWSRVKGTVTPVSSFTSEPPASGIYEKENGTLNITGPDWDITGGKNVVVFAGGKLRISVRNITVKPGSLLVFIVGTGGIDIDGNVEKLQGIYYTDGQFCTKTPCP